MNEIQKRMMLFLIGCIGFRLLITYLAKSNKNLASTIGWVSLIPAIGFFIIYIFGLRETGIETGGNLIWWNVLRPIHSVLLMIFAYLAINRNSYSWVVLLIDTLIGLIAWVMHNLK